MNNEIKLKDGIYISKGKDSKQFTDDGKVLIFPDASLDTSNNPVSNNKNDNSLPVNIDDLNKKPIYMYKNTSELIQILECEFIEFQEEICLLKRSNNDMIEFDPDDYDLIQAREDNLKLINKRLNQLRELQNKLKQFCPTHPFVLKDVFEIISLIENNIENPEYALHQILNEKERKIEEDKNDYFDNEDRNNNLNNEITGNVPSVLNINQRGNQEGINDNKREEILQEIDL